jgi:acetate kinase
MPAPLLVLNAGSSSLKLALFDDPAREPRLRAQVDGIGPAARWRRRDGDSSADRPALPADGDPAALLASVLDWLEARDARPPAAVVHRVVHGGMRFTGAVRIDASVRAALQALVPLAPLHQPHSLAAIDAVAARWPALPQIACFDTAFHAGQPALARQYALPRALTEAGVLRYGFHGLSCQYIAGVLAARWPSARRAIVAHLGGGASLTALHDGESIATSMGFTPLDGLPMATRCGSLDPGVVLYLCRERGMTVDAVEALLSRQSGLLGVSGVSGDMRTLLASDAPAAHEAIALFCYRINREIGSLVAALGGLDALVFTGGIGEHAAAVRAEVLAQAAWTGLRADADANARSAERISQDGSPVLALVLPTDEEAMMARLAGDAATTAPA